VFTADGKFKKLEDHSKNGYRDNTEFIDRSLLPSLQTIIAESEKPPVIIVMGDHGPPPGKNASAADRMKNLNAYFVNQETAADLYPTITPVNSFRVIFNHYFGENYPLLEDASYHAYKLKQLGKVDIMENTCAPAE
jgi:hypothetical protein